MNKPKLYDVRINNGQVEYFDGAAWVLYRRIR